MAASYHSRRARRKARAAGALRAHRPFTALGAFVSLLFVTAGEKPRAAPKLGEGSRQLTGRDNRWLRKFRAALRGGEAPADGSIGVEGPHLVEEALRASLPIVAILASAAGERHLAKLVQLVPPGIPVLRTTDRLFAGVADTQTPQGIAALVCPRVASFDDLVRGRPLVVVLVGVQDPGNVGAILRAAEAFGATGVATCAWGGLGTANPLSPKALRASAGSALRLPLVHRVAAPVLLAQLRVTGVKLYAASPRKHSSANQEGRALHPWEADLRGPSALLVGNEGAGLPLELQSSADALVRIPLESGVESLNTAVAASVLLYEAARQRGSDAPGLDADRSE